MPSKVTCKASSKRRYPDIGQARIAAKVFLGHKGLNQVAVYECERCKGYHLTKYTGSAAKHIVARDYLPEIAEWEAMDIIRTGPVTSNPDAGDRDGRWICKARRSRRWAGSC